ncbi:MAG: hypothetical protein Q9214_003979 [Letrouitia sp. 1 TL-2023]
MPRLVQEPQSFGTKVTICECDIFELQDVEALVKRCTRTRPPIHGVIHGAMVLQSSLDDWNTVILPRFYGAWNLHKHLLPYTLDFFVMLASTSGLAGNKGQAARFMIPSLAIALCRAFQPLLLTLVSSTTSLRLLKAIGHRI